MKECEVWCDIFPSDGYTTCSLLSSSLKKVRMCFQMSICHVICLLNNIWIEKKSPIRNYQCWHWLHFQKKINPIESYKSMVSPENVFFFLGSIKGTLCWSRYPTTNLQQQAVTANVLKLQCNINDMKSWTGDSRVMWKMPSQALIWDRKAFPRPWPEWAPFTRPAMSTTLRNAGTLLQPRM